MAERVTKTLRPAAKAWPWLQRVESQSLTPESSHGCSGVGAAVRPPGVCQDFQCGLSPSAHWRMESGAGAELLVLRLEQVPKHCRQG